MNIARKKLRDKLIDIQESTGSIDANINLVLSEIGTIIDKLEDNNCYNEILIDLNTIIGQLTTLINNISSHDIDAVNGQYHSTKFTGRIEGSYCQDIGNSEDIFFSAITIAYDSKEFPLESKATALQLEIGTKGVEEPVYSQYIPGTLENQQIGTLTMNFTYPLFILGQAEVRIKLFGAKTPSALVSFNIINCNK